MTPLRPSDLAAVPTYLLRGRPAMTQAVLVWIIECENRAARYTMKHIAACAGTSTATVRKVCGELEQEGVLTRREGQVKAPFAVNLSCLPPDRPENEPEQAVSKPQVPGWVFVCCKKWKAAQGVVQPRVMLAALKEAVSEYGEVAVIDGLERYAKGQDAKFNPSPWKYATQINKWIRKGPSRKPMSRDFASMA